jgi:transposase
VDLAAVKDDKTLAKKLAKDFEMHTTQVSEWKQLLLDSATRKAKSVESDIRVMHAKIGYLTLENDILEGALSTAGLQSVKR